MWSWAKTIYEKSSEQSMTTTQMLQAGGLTHEQIASTPDFGALFVHGVYRRILEEGGGLVDPSGQQHLRFLQNCHDESAAGGRNLN